MAEETDRVVVLGANGNVGTLLLRELIRRDKRVAGSLRPGRPEPKGSSNVSWLNVDLEDPASLRTALRSSDTVIWTPPVSLVPDNVEALESVDPRRILLISSASVHTRLESAGAEMKRAAEAAIHGSKLRYTIIRPTMIYGNARDRNLTRLLRYLRRFPLFPLFGNGSGLMQPVHIEDLVEAILTAVESPLAEGKTYDIGGAAPISYRRLVKLTAEAAGRRVYFLSIPLGLAAGMVRLANRAGIRLLCEEQIHRIAEDKVVDNGLISADLGIQPRSFAAGIADEVMHLRAPFRTGS